MDLDARTILALIRTASVGCIPVLRSAIYRHLRFEAVISATFHVRLLELFYLATRDRVLTSHAGRQ